MDFCTIASGSSGNCTFIGSSRTSVLVDTGLSGKKIEQGLFSIDRKSQEIDAICITHEHADHIQGLGVLARRYHIPIYATAGTIAAIRRMPQTGRIDEELFHVIREDEPFQIGEIEAVPFAISHDAAQPVGYVLQAEGKKAAVATDMGCYDEQIVSRLQGLDALVLEANHDVNMLQAGPYPYPLKMRILGERGHLSNELAGRLLGEILHDGMQKVFLGHLSKENNYAALALAAVRCEIAAGDNPYQVNDFDVSVAERYVPSELIRL